jgi:hypothetical protein
MRLLCNWLALHTSEPVPEGADPQNRRPFLLAALCYDAGVGWACVALNTQCRSDCRA